MDKFKGLFIEIFLEHWILQVIIYTGMAFTLTIGLVLQGIELDVAMAFSLAIVTAIKALSGVSSAIKAGIIVYKCNRGSVRFWAIYREWTGKRFDQ